MAVGSERDGLCMAQQLISQRHPSVASLAPSPIGNQLDALWTNHNAIHPIAHVGSEVVRTHVTTLALGFVLTAHTATGWPRIHVKERAQSAPDR